MRLLLIFALLCLISPAFGAPADAIVARVNSEVIMLSQLREVALDQDVAVQDLLSSGLRGDGYRRVLTAIVDETLLYQRALKDELSMSDAVLAGNVDRMIKELERQLGSHEALNKFLKDHSLSFEEFRDMLSRREKRRTLATEVVARRIKSDAATIAEFEKKLVAEEKPTEQIRLAHILIAVRDGGRNGEAGKAAYKKALSLARKIESNPSRFAEIARQNSDDAATRQIGGDLGWLDPETIRPELRDAAADLYANGTSEPVWAGDGWHVLQLVDRRGVRDLYFADAFGRERGKLLEQLRAEATIKIYNLE